MKFEFNILNKNSLEHQLGNLLNSIPDNMLFYKEHNERHPLGVFNVSLIRVYNALSRFLSQTQTINQRLDFLDKTSSPYDQEQYKLKKIINETDKKEGIQKRISELEKILHQNSKEKTEVTVAFLKDYKEILDSIMAFIDGTYIILKTLYPVSMVNRDTKFNYEWIRYADNNISYNYYNKIRDYRETLAIKVNKIKHNVQNMNFIRFITKLGKINGYYIEGIDPISGAIVPDLEIHKKYDGEYTAISFNYDLKYNIIGLFNTIKCLEKIVNSIIYKRHKTNINIIKSLEGDENWFSILDKIANIPALFFIDEYQKKIPMIATDVKNNKIVFEYANSNKILRYSEYIVESSASGDGVTRSFGIPYYKKRNK